MSKKKLKKLKYKLPDRDEPWVVEIEGQNYVIASTVGRLIIQLDKAAKAKKG